MKNILHTNRRLVRIAFLSCILLPGCSDFLDLELPSTLTPQNLVFADDISATSAVKGLYVDLINMNSFASGSLTCSATLSGLSADELDLYNDNSAFAFYEKNDIPVTDPNVLGLWSSAYKAIYDANSVLEGLRGSSGVTGLVKDQLEGEALFIRAYCYFYLINLFGDVSLITTTNYEINAKASRAPVADVYNLIEQDLLQARVLLLEEYQEYPDALGRARVNKSTATAFLARVDLYLEKWGDAEEMASVVISNPQYDTVSIRDVFLTASKEVIWQLRMPSSLNTNYTTFEGNSFIIQRDGDIANVLTDNLLNAFETGDKRKTNWIGRYISISDTVYFPYKYKIKYGSALPYPENSAVVRLAEQYLIRAEARVKQHKISQAIADVNVIRKRAGLPLLTGTFSEAEALLAIERERQVELFTEGSHRWFDLKRTGRANAVLSPIKIGWTPEDQLYPIPQSEFNKNPNLGEQNPGY